MEGRAVSDSRIMDEDLENDDNTAGSHPIRKAAEELPSPSQKKARRAGNTDEESGGDECVSIQPKESDINDNDSGKDVIDTIIRLSYDLFVENNTESGKLLADILSVDDLEYIDFTAKSMDHGGTDPIKDPSTAHMNQYDSKLYEIVRLLESDDPDSMQENLEYANDSRAIIDKLALKVWKKIGDEDKDPRGMILAGLSYFKGKGTRPDVKKALHYWKLAARLGDKAASMLLARYYQSEMPEKGISSKGEDLKEYGSQNNSEEDASLHSDDNDNSSFNSKDFLRYTVIAASEGDAQSLKMLGLVYQDGLFGVKPSPKKALKMYLKAAEKNELFSMFRAAEIYYHGASNVPSDREAALRILTKAAESAPIPNWECLGNLYRFGVGAPGDKPDLLNCVKCYKKAAEAGSISALKSLADVCWSIFIKGKSSLKNDIGALGLTTESMFEYYERAAASGELGAMLGLAKCYWRGAGVDKSEDKCRGIIQQAIEKLEYNGHKVDFSSEDGQNVMSLIIETDILNE